MALSPGMYRDGLNYKWFYGVYDVPCNLSISVKLLLCVAGGNHAVVWVPAFQAVFFSGPLGGEI